MEGLAELHTHLGGSVSSDILWSLAHRQGIALPVKDFWDFDRLVTVSDPRGVPDLDALEAIGGAYRSQGITTLELRFNPMKRNRGGERDLDHIILAAIRGLDVASLEYRQVRAGLILMMDRTFTPHQNEIIVEKAIRWAPRGVVGLDIAGPRPGGARYDYSQVQPMVEEARAAGLGVTIHVGEEGAEMGRAEIGEVLELLRPDRIGHGILAAGDDDLMRELREREVVLEICPTSNLLTKSLPDEDAVRDVFRTFVDNGVLFTIATDGPEMMRTHLRDEFDLLLRSGALTQGELDAANVRGDEVSCIGGAHAARSNTPVGRELRLRRGRSVPSHERHRRGKARPDRAPAPDRCADRARVLEQRGRRASRHLAQDSEGALRRAAPEARRAEAAADSCRVQGAHRRGPPRA